MQHHGLLALLCDADGTVVKVLANSLPLDRSPAVGAAWTTLLDASQGEHAALFLQRAREQGACVEGEFTVQANGQGVLLRVAAAAEGTRALILAGTRPEVARFASELARGPEGEVCGLHELARRLDAGLAAAPGGAGAEVAELTRLKKECLSLEQELVRKQEALEGLQRQLTEEAALRRRLEEEFRNQTVHLAEAQALAHLGSWDWEISTGCITWSDEIYRILGFAPQAFRASYEVFLPLVHPADRPRVEHALAEALKCGGGSYAEEFRMCPPGGSERVLFSRGTVVRGPNGEPLHMLGMAQDITERKQAERALRESQARYRDLVESSPDTVFVARGGKFAYINPAGLKLFGATAPEQLLGRPVLERVHPHYQALVQGRIERMERRSEPAPLLQEQMLRLDGSAVEVELTALPFIYEGQPAAQVVVHDISLRKAAERRIAFQASLLDQVRNAVIATDLQGHIIYWNQFAETLYQWQAAEVLGKSILQLTVPAGAGPEAAAIVEAIRAQGFWEGEFTVRRKDGHPFRAYMVDVLLKDERGEPVGMVGVSVDLTESKQAEAALRESQERSRTLMEHSNDLIWAVDTQGHFTFANRRCEEVSGYRLEEFRGRSFVALALPEELPQVWRSFEEASAGRAQAFEFRVRRADGSLLLVAGTSAPIRQNGKIVGVVSFGRDITQERQAQEALRQLSGQLLRVQEEERRRIARELHDSTAQKLASVLMSLGLLEDAAAGLPARARRLLAECLAATEDCAQETRNLAYLLHPPLLDELGLEVALDTYVAGFAERSGVRTRLEIDRNLADLPREACLALFRVVQESLANVLRHARSHSVSVQLARVRDRLILEITDEGQGMAPEMLEQLRHSRPGLGVGIMGMRERLRQLKGTLEIDSSVQGTTIRAIVPLEAATLYE